MSRCSFVHPVINLSIRAESLRACGRVPESPDKFFRRVYGGLAPRYRYAVELLENASGRHIQGINVLGGGSQDAFAYQCTANASQRTVLAGPADASSAICWCRYKPAARVGRPFLPAWRLYSHKCRRLRSAISGVGIWIVKLKNHSKRLYPIGRIPNLSNANQYVQIGRQRRLIRPLRSLE